MVIPRKPPDASPALQRPEKAVDGLVSPQAQTAHEQLTMFAVWAGGRGSPAGEALDDRTESLNPVKAPSPPVEAGNAPAGQPSKAGHNKTARRSASVATPITKAGDARKDAAEDVHFEPELDIGVEVETAVRELTAFTDEKPNELAALIPSRPGISLDHKAVKAYLLMHDYALEQGLKETDVRVFRTTVVRLEREAGILGKDRVGLKVSLRALVGATVEWNTPRLNSKGETTVWEASSMLAYVRFLYDRNHNLVVEWSYSDPLREKLKLVGNYFRMRLKSLRETRTYGGWALYLYLSRYRTFAGHRTDAKHWRDWVTILTGKHLDDFEKPPKENVGNSWRYFHRDVVRRAVAEVNAIQNDFVAVERFQKAGNRVTDVWFELQPVPVEQSDARNPIDGSVIQRLVALDYKEKDAERLLGSSKRENLLQALDYVELRISRNVGKTILNKPAYLRSILEKCVAGEIGGEGGKDAGAFVKESASGPQSALQMDAHLRGLLHTWAKEDIGKTLAKGRRNEACAELLRIFESEGLPTLHERTQKAWASKGLDNSIVRAEAIAWLAVRIHPVPEEHGELLGMALRHQLISFGTPQA